MYVQASKQTRIVRHQLELANLMSHVLWQVWRHVARPRRQDSPVPQARVLQGTVPRLAVHVPDDQQRPDVHARLDGQGV